MLYGNPFGGVMMRCIKAGDIDGMCIVSKLYEYIYYTHFFSFSIDFFEINLEIVRLDKKKEIFDYIYP